MTLDLWDISLPSQVVLSPFVKEKLHPPARLYLTLCCEVEAVKIARVTSSAKCYYCMYCMYAQGFCL